MLERGGPAAASPASPTVPATLHTTLNARLDRLGTNAKHTAQAGAAIGREFAHDMLPRRHMSDHAITPALRQLEDARLVHRRGIPPNAKYSFRHALLRDAAYGMLLREPRRTLHAHIAEAITRLHPDVAEREPQLLAWHYTRAGLADQAIEHWRRAGVLSVARFANLEAIGHFQQALEMLRSWPKASGGTGSRPSYVLRKRSPSLRSTASGRRWSRPAPCGRKPNRTPPSPPMPPKLLKSAHGKRRAGHADAHAATAVSPAWRHQPP